MYGFYLTPSLQYIGHHYKPIVVPLFAIMILAALQSVQKIDGCNEIDGTSPWKRLLI